MEVVVEVVDNLEIVVAIVVAMIAVVETDVGLKVVMIGAGLDVVVGVVGLEVVEGVVVCS